MTTWPADGGCSIKIGHHLFSPSQQEELERYLASLRDRRIFLSWDETTSYRCLGGAIFALQKSGVAFRMAQKRGE